MNERETTGARPPRDGAGAGAHAGPGGVLEGVRVVDFARQMSGPYASALLGDFGADVVKVERPPAGDPPRRIGSRLVGGESEMFLTWNRSKRSVWLDARAEPAPAPASGEPAEAPRRGAVS